jgi:hypothetical protein
MSRNDEPQIAAIAASSVQSVRVNASGLVPAAVAGSGARRSYDSDAAAAAAVVTPPSSLDTRYASVRPRPRAKPLL